MSAPGRPPTTTPAATLCVVTAADAAFGRCLWQFLRGLERDESLPTATVVVFDLGLGRHRPALARRFPWAAFRDFDFPAHPPHVARLSHFAWKPLAIAAARRGHPGDLLWLDSATLLREPLAAVHARVRRQPILTLAGQSRIREHCAPAVLDALGVPGPVRDAPERAAGVVGLRADAPLADAVLAEWCTLALRPELIAIPPGFPRHKCDQALLSIILQRRALAGELALEAGAIDISCAHPVRWLTTRNKVAPGLPTAMDPLVRAWYATVKRIDQVAWRIRHYKATRINGLHRWPKERFEVLVTRTGATPRRIAAPRWSYFADPFLAVWNDQPALFVEEFLHAEHRGRLVAMPLDAELQPGAPQPLVLHGGPAGHLSYPHVFAHGDSLYLVPESAANRAVDLFVCEEFPQRWRWCRRLLDDIDAVDSNVWFHAGRWWLLTFARHRPGEPRALELYHAADLHAEAWVPHPVNRERRYAGAPHSSGRNAGACLPLTDGTWLRPVHASTRYYGEGVRCLHLHTLTPDVFAESEFAGTHPAADLARAWPLHHVAAAANLLAADLRTRTSYGQHLPLLRRWATAPDARATGLIRAVASASPGGAAPRNCPAPHRGSPG